MTLTKVYNITVRFLPDIMPLGNPNKSSVKDLLSSLQTINMFPPTYYPVHVLAFSPKYCRADPMRLLYYSSSYNRF